MAGEGEETEKDRVTTESFPADDNIKDDDRNEDEPIKSDEQEGTEEIVNGEEDIEHESVGPEGDASENNREKRPMSPPSNERLMRLPLSRIKFIMKTDPDVTLASQEAVVALAKATELFIGALSKDAVVSTMNSKRKTLQRKDLDNVIDTRDGYAFLEGTLD